MSQLKRGGEKRIICGLFILSILLEFVVSQTATQGKLFDGCDFVFNITQGESYVESPYYPDPYPPGSSCRYKFVAPLDYGIEVECNINLTKDPTRCSTENFYLARDGDINMFEGESFCGIGTFKRASMFNSLAIGYVSEGSTGKWMCKLNAQPRPCDCGWSVNSRISNGKDAVPNEYPSAVALKDRTNPLETSFCGASIISHYYLLTAAHCTDRFLGPQYIVALVGNHNLLQKNESRYAAQYDIERIIRHPWYNSAIDPPTNDIAILRTTTAIQWSRGVGPICLPPVTSSSDQFAYLDVDVIGWGDTKTGGVKADTLQKVTLLVTDNPTCTRYYSNISPILPSQICTYDSLGQHRDACRLDSGGPVILRKTRQFQVGIISFGNACGLDGYSTGINTRITSFLYWIQQVTQRTTCNVALN